MQFASVLNSFRHFQCHLPSADSKSGHSGLCTEKLQTWIGALISGNSCHQTPPHPCQPTGHQPNPKENLKHIDSEDGSCLCRDKLKGGGSGERNGKTSLLAAACCLRVTHGGELVLLLSPQTTSAGWDFEMKDSPGCKMLPDQANLHQVYPSVQGLLEPIPPVRRGRRRGYRRVVAEPRRKTNKRTNIRLRSNTCGQFPVHGRSRKNMQGWGLEPAIILLPTVSPIKSRVTIKSEPFCE